MKQIAFLVIIFTFVFHNCSAQITGGQGVYNFLNLPSSVKQAAMGGDVVALQNADLGFIIGQPSLLAAKHSHNIYLLATRHIAKSIWGGASFAYTLPKSKVNFATGVYFLNHEKQTRTNEFGENIGNVFNTEATFYVASSYPILPRTHIGVSVQAVNSNLDNYISTGLVGNLGITYHDTTHNFMLTLLVDQVGVMLDSYSNTKEPLDYDIKLGLSKRLQYLPLEISLTIHHLNQFDIRYNDPAANVATNLFDDPNTKPKTYFVSKVLNHLSVGGDLKVNKWLQLQAGYNHLRRSELGAIYRKRLSGFTMGFAIKTKRWGIQYAYTPYHVGANVHSISLLTKLPHF